MGQCPLTLGESSTLQIYYPHLLVSDLNLLCLRFVLRIFIHTPPHFRPTNFFSFFGVVPFPISSYTRSSPLSPLSFLFARSLADSFCFFLLFSADVAPCPTCMYMYTHPSYLPKGVLPIFLNYLVHWLLIGRPTASARQLCTPYCQGSVPLPQMGGQSA